MGILTGRVKKLLDSSNKTAIALYQQLNAVAMLNAPPRWVRSGLGNPFGVWRKCAMEWMRKVMSRRKNSTKFARLLLSVQSVQRTPKMNQEARKNPIALVNSALVAYADSSPMPWVSRRA